MTNEEIVSNAENGCSVPVAAGEIIPAGRNPIDTEAAFENNVHARESYSFYCLGQPLRPEGARSFVPGETFLEDQKLLTLAMEYVPVSETDLRREIGAMLAVRMDR